jgi:uncharacterized protein (DUF924 family)
VRAELASTYSDQVDSALLEGELAGWEETPEGSLAKLLLLGPIGEVKANVYI